MSIIKAFLACFSTYSRIPMPRVDLDSNDMKYSFVFFPFIGAVIGIIQYFLYVLAYEFSLPRFILAIVSAVVPILITGGIHIDGYMDTMDAFSSFGNKEKKLQIMKDPHAGAFAIIYLLVYEMLYVACIYMMSDKGIILFSMSFILSRILSGIAVCTLKNAKSDGMLHSVSENSAKDQVFFVLVLMFILAIVYLCTLNLIPGIVTGLTLISMFFIYKRKCYKALDGTTGDTAGYYLCMMELVMAFIAAIVSVI